MRFLQKNKNTKTTRNYNIDNEFSHFSIVDQFQCLVWINKDLPWIEKELTMH